MKDSIEIKSIENRIVECEKQMVALSVELKALKSGHWAFGDDTKTLDYIEISCNHESWALVKEDNHLAPFYIESKSSDDSVDFNVDDAKEVIIYLQEKLEYLES